MPAPLRDSAYKRLVRLGAASPKLTLGNVDANADEIITAIVKANDFGVDYLALPELCLVGATAGTLMRQPILLRAVRGALIRICEKTRNTGAIAAVGLPYDINGNIRSCVALVGGGRVYAIIPSDCACMPFGFLPELDYCGDGDCALTPIPRLALRFGNELFDDPANVRTAPRCAMLMPSALNATVNSCQRVRNALSAYSARTGAAIAYAAPGLGESVTSAVFDGICAIAANGEIVAAADPLSDNPFIFADVALSQLTPFEPYVAMEDNPSTYLSAQEATAKRQCERILDLQGAALSRRLTHINAKGFVIGVSGGVDSALSLLAAVNAMDKLGMERTRVTGVSMPGFGTTDRTKNNAKKLVKALSCTYREISVKEACLQHFADIGHNENTHDVVFENAQARERTKILLDIANMENLLNVGTGDLSEAALGWTTFAGDHLAQYAINASLPKTVIRRVLDVAKSRFPRRLKCSKAYWTRL